MVLTSSESPQDFRRFAEWPKLLTSFDTLKYYLVRAFVRKKGRQIETPISDGFQVAARRRTTDCHMGGVVPSVYSLHLRCLVAGEPKRN